MPIDCVWIGDLDDAPRELICKPGTDETVRPPGVCYWSPYTSSFLSKHYLDNVAAIRRPIVVELPYRQTDGRDPEFIRWHGCSFHIDSHPTSEPDAAWSVTVDMDSLIVGAKPLITVQPSIKCMDIYHGFLTDGVLTDDIGD
jgi:hypothetical protein